MPENTYIPEWVPSIWHDIFKKYWGNVPKEQLPETNEGISAFNKALRDLHASETGFAGDLHTLANGEANLTPKFVESVLTPERSYGTLWQLALLKHPDVDRHLPPGMLKQIAENPKYDLDVRIRAFLKDPDTSYKAPPDIINDVGADPFIEPTEDKLVQLINSSDKHSNFTKGYIKRKAEAMGSRFETLTYQHETRLPPKVETAIANHPDMSLLVWATPAKFTSDENFDKFMSRLSNREDSKKSAGGLAILANNSSKLTPEQRSKLVKRSIELKNNADKTATEDQYYNEDLNASQTQLLRSGLSDEETIELYKDPSFYYYHSNDHFYNVKNKEKVVTAIANHYLDKTEQIKASPTATEQDYSAASEDAYNVSLQAAARSDDPETLERIRDTFRQSRAFIRPLVVNPNTHERLLRDIYDNENKVIERSQASGYGPDEAAMTNLAHMYFHKNLPKDLAEGLVRENITPFHVSGSGRDEFFHELNPHAERALIDGLVSGQYTIDKMPKRPNLYNRAARALIRTVKNPDDLRKLNEFVKKDHKEFYEPYPIFPWVIDHSDNQDPFARNPNTPADVLEDRSDLYINPDALVKHPNFPEKTLEYWAESPDDIEDEGFMYRKATAERALSFANPDKYKNPANNEFDEPGVDHGTVEVKPTVPKLRVLRDKITELDPVRGEISPKQAGQGPFDGGWKPLQEKNGNISVQKIQQFIDSQPSMKYRFEHTNWDGAQRHSQNNTQRVFMLNVGTDLVRKLKEAGVYDTFRNISNYSEESGHPSEGGHTIGWVRYEHHSQGADPKHKQVFNTAHDTPQAIHVDEIQTDMGPNTIKKLKENPESARGRGVDPDKLETVHKIVFGDKHPSEVLLEAFRQHHRNQGRHNIEIHMLDSKTKAPISGQNNEKELPVHMKNTYTDMPKKLGFKPAKYGATDQQNNEKIVGQPTWTDKIRKFEEEAISKAISKIKPGKQLSELDYDSDMINNMPDHYRGKLFSFDYNHLLSPELKRSGYRLYVNHIPEHHIMAELFHKKQSIGQIGTRINFLNPNMLEIHNAAIGDDDRNPQHRGKGLGTAMYEAVLAHAYHNGITHVSGQDHSTMAHNVHKRLAEKHGLEYKAKKNFAQRQVAPGPYDDKYQGYQYLLKSEELEKAQKPEDFKSIVRATSQEGKNFVDDSAEHTAHPPAIASSADSYRTTIQQTPQVQKRQVGKASSGITKKVLYQAEGGPKFMVKPYHEGIVRRISKWQKHPIQGWAEMTNQALYHAAGMGDLHQKVHVSHHDMGTGTPEPALVVELANGYKPSSEWKPIGEDTGRVVDWDGDIEPDEMRGAITYGDKLPGELEYKRKYHIHKTIEPDRESIRKIGLMDFLTNNLDRHHGNIMYDKAGKPLAIDHSRSFQYVNNWSFKNLNPTQVKRRADFSDEFGNYIRPIYTAVGAYEGSRLDMENWSPIINEWWPKNRDNVVNTMEQRLSQIKDPNVKNHIRRNFMERVGWLDERAQLGLENFGFEDWDKSPVQQYLPHQKSDWENEDGTGVRWNTKKE